MSWPKLKRDRKGMRCRILRPMRNHVVEMPSGATATVDGLWGNGSYANLQFDPCGHCGAQVFISKVDWRSIEPLREGDE